MDVQAVRKPHVIGYVTKYLTKSLSRGGQGQRDAKPGSHSSLRASPMPASDRQWCLKGILDHTGGPARSTSIKPISGVILLLPKVKPFFMRSGVLTAHGSLDFIWSTFFSVTIPLAMDGQHNSTR